MTVVEISKVLRRHGLAVDLFLSVKTWLSGAYANSIAAKKAFESVFFAYGKIVPKYGGSGCSALPYAPLAVVIISFYIRVF